MAFINDRNSEPWRTLDPVRNIVLTRTGGVGQEKISFYELHWQGEEISFRVKWDTLRNAEGKKIIVHYAIGNIGIPKKLVSKKEEVMILIKEALDAHGFVFNKDNVESVKVNFESGL